MEQTTHVLQHPDRRQSTDGRAAEETRLAAQGELADAPASVDSMSDRHRGVYFRGKRWVARITRENVTYHLGTFDTQWEAIEAYRAKAIELAPRYYSNPWRINVQAPCVAPPWTPSAPDEPVRVMERRQRGGQPGAYWLTDLGGWAESDGAV
jgi:hypothetical protein